VKQLLLYSSQMREPAAFRENPAAHPITALAALGWPAEALKREAALIAALPASRAQFIALLDAIRPE
jgi:hypothetical protein